MATARQIARMLFPPILWAVASRLRRARPVEWEYVHDGWAYADRHPEVRGWNVKEILEVNREKWPTFVRMVAGAGPLGVAHESDLTTNEDLISHNLVMSFGYVLGLAARRRESVSVLDWGGGIGHFNLFARALFPCLRLEYHCKDVPLLAESGAQLFPDAQFISDDSCLGRKYDLVMASTSLHYQQDWRSLLARLAASTGDYLYLANVPSVLGAHSFVFVQRPYAYGYNTEYLSWCLNRGDVLAAAGDNGLRLVREFVYGLAPRIAGAPEQNRYRGFLFERHAEEDEAGRSAP